jgi:hypothetical protein
LGGLAALVSATCLLEIIWGHWQHDPGPAWLRTFGVTGIVALTCAQFSLLLAAVRRSARVETLVRATLGVGTVLAVLLSAAVLGWQPDGAEGRLIGVVAIVDVLGTVASIALALFGGNREAARTLTVVVPGPLAARVRASAKASGRDPADLVREVLARAVETDPPAIDDVTTAQRPGGVQPHGSSGGHGA